MKKGFDPENGKRILTLIFSIGETPEECQNNGWDAIALLTSKIRKVIIENDLYIIKERIEKAEKGIRESVARINTMSNKTHASNEDCQNLMGAFRAATDEEVSAVIDEVVEEV